MDEAVRIYNPVKRPAVSIPIHFNQVEATVKVEKPSVPEKQSKWKFFCDWTLWKKVLDQKEEEVRVLHTKYPWFPIMVNWVIAVLIVVLFIGFIIWGIDIRTERTAVAYAEAVAAEKDAEHQAFLAQMEADRKAEQESLENLMKANAQVKAKLGYGSRNFIDKYHYGDADFMTLYQCVDNRLKNKMYTGMTMEEIVFQDGQFIAAYDSNPVQNYYYNLALKSEQLKQNQTSEPVGSDFVYTIYTEHGIYLANDPKAPAYTWWHYSE